MAGKTSGMSTERVVRPAPAPRSALASNSDRGTRSKPAYTGMIMYGSQR